MKMEMTAKQKICCGVAALGLGLALVAMSLSSAAAQSCAPDAVHLTGPEREIRFSVDVADDDAERARGLMFRAHMPTSHGMLFVYDAPRTVHFWMENTPLPLDMLFVDRRGVVMRIHENAVPFDRTVIPGGDNVFAVLEINGGLVQQLGISVGDALTHPAFGPEAAVPCDR